MNEREALTLALEFVDNLHKADWGNQERQKVITAIKESLAQPEYQSTADKSKLERVSAKGTLLAQLSGSVEQRNDSEQQEPVIGTKTWFEDGKVVTQHLTAKDIYKDPEQPEQEPVAYEPMWGGGPTNKDYEDAMRARRLSELTTPPQRKPLTDEEEREAFEDYALRTICNPVELQRKRLSGYGSEELNYLWRGWKARAAHGIKGDA